MKMTQKEAVFQAITSVLTEAGVAVNEGDNFSNHMNREHRAAVTNILVEGFKSGTVELEKSFESDAALRVYCSGLTSNWLRKDKRLNGGEKYSPKNPGSRVGSSDPQIKALRALLQSKSDPSDREEIQGYINTRLAEIGTTKTKKVTVDFDSLPEELRAKYSA
jgi:hypothetical protein